MVVCRMTQRKEDTERFYELLKCLEEQIDGKRILANCCAHQNWPPRGVYFFFEKGEYRTRHSNALRVVRVGTTTGQHSTLWGRLSQHRAHNGSSVFRRHLRYALANKEEIKAREMTPRRVSEYIRQMPFVFLRVFEENGQVIRDTIEQNATALLSNYDGKGLYKPSGAWLGNHRGHKTRKIEKSGLWSVNYIDPRKYNQPFLCEIEQRIDHTAPVEPCPECPWTTP